MIKNKELRTELETLHKNMQDSLHLIGVLNAKIALLSTLLKNGNGQNPNLPTRNE